ncbi:hypothetical protein [Bartonella rattaustraliani]|uniref:hypothetical protein n=1 Tax=Bartonella rattaustraliani TaxID=481139 RepID=UPI0002E95332|nr:hypothetical protein [Bartonella rattaustraliani]
MNRLHARTVSHPCAGKVSDGAGLTLYKREDDCVLWRFIVIQFPHTTTKWA